MNALHCGNLPDFHAQHIPGVQAAGLAHAYDALVSQRVYKPAYTHAEALAMIRRGECGAFDPLLVDCLEDIQGALCREVYGMRGKE